MWLILLSIIPPSFIHIVQMARFHSFLWLTIFHCTYIYIYMWRPQIPFLLSANRSHYFAGILLNCGIVCLSPVDHKLPRAGVVSSFCLLLFLPVACISETSVLKHQKILIFLKSIWNLYLPGYLKSYLLRSWRSPHHRLKYIICAWIPGLPPSVMVFMAAFTMDYFSWLQR